MLHTLYYAYYTYHPYYTLCITTMFIVYRVLNDFINYVHVIFNNEHTRCTHAKSPAGYLKIKATVHLHTGMQGLRTRNCSVYVQISDGYTVPVMVFTEYCLHHKGNNVFANSLTEFIQLCLLVIVCYMQ